MTSRHRSSAVVIVAICSLAACGTSTPDPAAGGATADERVLVWADEFDGTTLDPGRWWAEHSTYGDGGGSLHCYTPDSVLVADGLLRLTARQATVTCPGGDERRYTSGMVRTEGLASFTHGRFEVRLRAPRGAGLWSAAWLGPEQRRYGPWPASGEIDLIEILGDAPGRGVSSLHWAGPEGAPARSTGEVALDDGFHVHGLTWTPEALSWDVDGTEHHRVDTWDVPPGATFPAPFDQPFAIRMNLAVGGDWPGAPTSTTAFPAALEVDWVRVYDLG